MDPDSVPPPPSRGNSWPWRRWEAELHGLSIAMGYLGIWLKQCHKPSPKSPYMGGIDHQKWGGLWHCFNHIHGKSQSKMDENWMRTGGSPMTKRKPLDR